MKDGIISPEKVRNPRITIKGEPCKAYERNNLVSRMHMSNSKQH